MAIAVGVAAWTGLITGSAGSISTVLALSSGSGLLTFLIAHPFMLNMKIRAYMNHRCRHDVPGGITVARCDSCTRTIREQVALSQPRVMKAAEMRAWAREEMSLDFSRFSDEELELRPPDRPPERPDAGEWEEKEYLIAAISFSAGLALLSKVPDLWFVFRLGLPALAAWFISRIAHAPLHQLRLRLYEIQPCLHSIAGGVTMNRCSECRRQTDARQAQAAHVAHRKAEREKYRTAAIALKRSEHSRLHHAVSLDVEALLSITPYQFEDRIASLYRELGYTVHQTPYSGDEGRDAVAVKDGRTYLIECKQFRPDRPVGRRDLQIFHSAVVVANAERGFFVTTGRLTESAVAFVADKGIELVGLAALRQLMFQAYPQGGDHRYEALCPNCGVRSHLVLGSTPPRGPCSCGAPAHGILTFEDVIRAPGPSPTRNGNKKQRGLRE